MAPATKKKPRRKSKPSVGGYVSTAYGPPWGGINGEGIATACGVKINGGSPIVSAVAAGSNFPCGTILAIKPNPYGSDEKPFVVWDRGGAIGSKNIDFYLPSRSAQLKWGRRNVSVRDTGKSISPLPSSPSAVQLALAKAVVTGVTTGSKAAGTAGDILDDINPIDDVAEAVAAIGKFIARLFEPEFWVRVGKVVLGAGAVAFGVVILARAILGVDLPSAAGRGRRRYQERPVRGKRGRELESQREKIERNKGWQSPADDVPF